VTTPAIIRLGERDLAIETSAAAAAALAGRATPLVAEMELYFSCLIRKQLRFPADPHPDALCVPVAGGLTVVHTPGHSPGHCSFLHPSTGVLITGDAIFNVLGLRYSPASFCTDVRLSRETAGRLGELDFAVAAFTHGAHVSSGARAAVRAFLAGRPR